MATNSWSGLSPKQQQLWDQWFDKYVPSEGKADTVGGEIVRAMTRIIYRFFNDGDMVGISYGNTTCNSSDRYLSTTIAEYKSLDGISEYEEDEYSASMLRNHRIVFRFLKANPNLFTTPNTFDSREVSDEDCQREREWYDGEYDAFGENEWDQDEW